MLYELTDGGGDGRATFDARGRSRTVTVEASGALAEDAVVLVVGAFLAKYAAEVRRRRRRAAVIGGIAGSSGG